MTHCIEIWTRCTPERTPVGWRSSHLSRLAIWAFRNSPCQITHCVSNLALLRSPLEKHKRAPVFPAFYPIALFDSPFDSSMSSVARHCHRHTTSSPCTFADMQRPSFSNPSILVIPEIWGHIPSNGMLKSDTHSCTFAGHFNPSKSSESWRPQGSRLLSTSPLNFGLHNSFQIIHPLFFGSS